MRMSKGISQLRLAHLLGISQTHMSNIENGNTGMSLTTAIKIGKSLDCSVDELIYGQSSSHSKVATDMLTDLLEGISAEDLLKALGLVIMGKNCRLDRQKGPYR